jgi:hypothetical protein
MTTLTVYDPAMCCSTGICGTEVDQKLVNFAADLDWLKSLGIAVKRINLSQEPAAFAENAKVKSVLETSGIEGLPVVLIDDDLRSTGRFPLRQELAEMAGVDYAPTTMNSANKAQAGGCCGGDDGDEAPSGCC